MNKILAYFTSFNSINNQFSIESEYTITYNSNTGIGSMEEQTVSYNVNTNLRPNAYTKEGYIIDFSTLDKTFNAPVSIGASLDGNGNPQRYFKGTLSNIKVILYDE